MSSEFEGTKEMFLKDVARQGDPEEIRLLGGLCTTKTYSQAQDWGGEEKPVKTLREVSSKQDFKIF